MRSDSQITANSFPFKVDLDEGMAAADPLAELEDTGHAAERVWQVHICTFSGKT